LLTALLVSCCGSAARAQGGARPDAAATARFKSGQEALRSGQLAEAEKAFLEAIRLDPTLTAARCALGQTYMALRQYGSAVEALTTCKAETLRQADRSQADAAKLDQQRDEEIRELRDSVRMLGAGDQRSIGITKRIEQLEMQKARGERAALPPEISFALGTALLRVGSLDAAERELLEATKARPGYGEAHNNLAAVYVGKGQWPEAEEQVALAVKAGFKVPPQLAADIRDKHSSMKVVAAPLTEAEPPTVAAAPAGPLRIDHERVDCVLADAFPQIEARIDSEAGPTASLRFRAQGESRWYAVAMFPREQVFTAVLPKPKTGAKGIEYSIAATDRYGKAETQAFAAAVVEKADGCAGKRLAALAIAPAQIDVAVPEGTRSLPPGFSDKNVVGRYDSGKPVKGHPRTAVLAALGAGAVAGGVAAIGFPHNQAPTAGQVQLEYIRLSASTPPQGSTVSLKSGSLMLTIEIDLASAVPPGANVTVDLHADAAGGSPSCVTLAGILPAGLKSFTPTQVTVGMYSALNPACGSSFDVVTGRVFIKASGEVYVQTSTPGFGTYPDLAVQYRLTP
jgi:Tfp pilus assembly protein PilF